MLTLPGNKRELNFGTLSIRERIMLSSYLTYICAKEKSTINNIDLYNLIFNFNSKNVKPTSYQDAFIKDLSDFIYTEPYYFAFIKTHFNKIENDKTFIYRSQLNQSEMDILYSLKFQKNYYSLMNVLYIMGVAKQNSVSTALNKLNLTDIYSSVSMARQRIDFIFKKINSVSTNKINYLIKDGIVYFGNGFNVHLEEKFYSEDKKMFEANAEIQNILDTLCDTKFTKEETAVIDNIKKEEEKPIGKPDPVVPEYTEDEDIIEEENNDLDSIIMTEEDIDDILNLGEERRFNLNDLEKIYQYEENFDHNFIQNKYKEYENYFKSKSKNPADVLRIALNTYTLLDSNNFLTKYKNLNNFINKKFPADKYGETKDLAREELKTLKDKVCAAFTKLYDSDNTKNKNCYLLVVFWTLKTHKSTLIMNF